MVVFTNIKILSKEFQERPKTPVFQISKAFFVGVGLALKANVTVGQVVVFVLHEAQQIL